jgi:uncharacterized membrane protein HdeD (DUF308 family)
VRKASSGTATARLIPGGWCAARTEMPTVDGVTESPVVDETPDSPYPLVLVLGIVTTCFGIVVLVWPDATVRATAILVGLWLLVAGAARVVAAFLSHRGLGRQVLSGIAGVVMLVAGAACLRDVARGVVVLALMVAVSWLLSGAAALALAARMTGGTRHLMMALGVVSMTVGVGFLVWPDLSLAVFAVMVALSALAIGISEIVFALHVRATLVAQRR